MLFEKLSNIEIVKGSDSVGVTVNLLSETSYDIDYVYLTKEKNSIGIKEQAKGLSHIDKLAEAISVKLPLHLNIIGKGIIHRKFEGDGKSGASPNEIVNSFFPNADSNEFIIQKTNLKDGFFISLIRKNLLDELIGQFVKKGFYIVAANIGPFALHNCISLFGQEAENTIINACKLELEIKGGEVQSINSLISEKEKTYTIADQSIHQDNLLSFASAFTFYMPVNNFSGLDLKELNIAGDEYIYKRLFTLMGWGILIFVFAILLINYLFFENYNKKYNTLSLEYGKRVEIVKDLQVLSKELALKEKFVADNNLQANTKFSYYCDRLVLLMPKEISLNEVICNPLASAMKKNKDIEVVKKKILVKGQVSINKSLNEWIKLIEKEDWVENAEIVKFYQKGKNVDAEFELEIVIN